jgi:hypothetical protein
MSERDAVFGCDLDCSREILDGEANLSVPEPLLTPASVIVAAKVLRFWDRMPTTVSRGQTAERISERCPSKTAAPTSSLGQNTPYIIVKNAASRYL